MKHVLKHFNNTIYRVLHVSCCRKAHFCGMCMTKLYTYTVFEEGNSSSLSKEAKLP